MTQTFKDFLLETGSTSTRDSNEIYTKKNASGHYSLRQNLRGTEHEWHAIIHTTPAGERHVKAVGKPKYVAKKWAKIQESFGGDSEPENSEAKVRSSKSAAAGIVRKLKKGGHTPEKKKRLMHDFHMHMATVTDGMGLKMRAQDHRTKQKKYL